MIIDGRSDGTDGRFYLARHEGEPVGVLHVTPDDGCVVIEHVYVTPPARRAGVGTALIAAAEADLDRPVRHDGRLSPAGAALVRNARVRTRHGSAVGILDADLTEETGEELLRSVAGTFE